jgi:hypothetical protein
MRIAVGRFGRSSGMLFQLPLVELFEQCEQLTRRKTVAGDVEPLLCQRQQIGASSCVMRGSRKLDALSHRLPVLFLILSSLGTEMVSPSLRFNASSNTRVPPLRTISTVSRS